MSITDQTSKHHSTIQQVVIMALTELLPGSNSKDSVGVVTVKKVLW